MYVCACAYKKKFHLFWWWLSSSCCQRPSVRPSSDTKTKLPLARDSLYFSKCKRERERGNACVACVVVTNWATRAPPPHQWNGGRRRSPWDRWPSSYRDAKRSLQPDVVVVGCCCVDRPIALSHLKFRCRSAIFLLLSSPPPYPFSFIHDSQQQFASNRRQILDSPSDFVAFLSSPSWPWTKIIFFFLKKGKERRKTFSRESASVCVCVCAKRRRINCREAPHEQKIK